MRSLFQENNLTYCGLACCVSEAETKQDPFQHLSKIQGLPLRREGERRKRIWEAGPAKQTCPKLSSSFCVKQNSLSTQQMLSSSSLSHVSEWTTFHPVAKTNSDFYLSPRASHHQVLNVSELYLSLLLCLIHHHLLPGFFKEFPKCFPLPSFLLSTRPFYPSDFPKLKI